MWPFMISFNPLGVSSIWSMFSEVSGGLFISAQKTTPRPLKLLPDVSTQHLNFIQCLLEMLGSRYVFPGPFFVLEIFLNRFHRASGMIPLSNHTAAHSLFKYVFSVTRFLLRY